MGHIVCIGENINAYCALVVMSEETTSEDLGLDRKIT